MPTLAVSLVAPPDLRFAPMKHSTLLASLAILAALAGCGDDDSSSTSGGEGAGNGTGGSSAEGNGGSTSTGDPVSYLGAPGVTINEVAIYQGLKRTLVKDGVAGPADVPVIAGRDAVVRVFYTTDGSYDGGDVIGRLTIDGFDPIDVTGALAGPSTDGDIASTVNFSVPGAQIGASTAISVGLLREGAEGDADNAAARWPATGSSAIVPEGAASTFRITIAPFRYDYDGSGRLPDLSPEAIERFRNRFLQLYPVSNVEVTVREPEPWDDFIGPDGTGWQEVGIAVYGMRSSDPSPAETYYYGMFKPEATFAQYCGGGCLLGVTLLNNQPEGTGDPSLRLALGVGFEEYVDDTAVHEIGHAHGREHAPCGPGLDPQSIDSSFPHDGGGIGVWGLDTATLTLKPPTEFTDMMGYCENNWISDYNFRALLERGKNVNLPRWHEGPRVPAVMLSIDGKGGARWGGETTMPTDLRGMKLDARVFGADGRVGRADAQMFHWDHLPGGIAIVPAERDAHRIELMVAGQPLIAAR
jgi:hypothetical protein